MGNPDGTRPISAASLIQRHRDWIGRMPALTLADGTDFDKAKIVPYCYRHTYAQRHADAGIAAGRAPRPDEPSHHQRHPRATTGSGKTAAVMPSTR